MKIRKLKYKNHEILGSLEIDFGNTTTSQPYNCGISGRKWNRQNNHTEDSTSVYS